MISETPLRNDADWIGQWPRIESSYSEPTNTMDVIKPRFRAATPELLTRWNADRNKAGAWAMVNVMRAMRDFDAATALREVRGPAAAILGAKGNSMSKLAFYQECLGKDRVAVLPECGHFPMIDDPQLFVTEVNRLLAVASKQ